MAHCTYVHNMNIDATGAIRERREPSNNVLRSAPGCDMMSVEVQIGMPRPSLLSQGKTRKYEIQNLWDKHHQVLRMTALGVKPAIIAEQIGLSKDMVSAIVNSTIAQDLLRVMRGTLDKATMDVSLAIKELEPKAVQVLEHLLDSESERIRLSAAMDILDRGGHPAQKNVNFTHTHRVSAADLEEIKRRAEAAGLLSGDVIEMDEGEDACDVSSPIVAQLATSDVVNT